MTSSETQSEITRWLEAWGSGEEGATNELFCRVQDELRAMARARLARERPDHTLQPTALVNEAYLRLMGQRHTAWEDREHFFATAAQAMRRILVDHARRLRYAVRQEPFKKIALADAPLLARERPADLLALDDGLRSLAKIDPRKAKIVELRFWAGLSLDDTARVLDCSRATVVRQWKMAKTWLLLEFENQHDSAALAAP